MSVDPSARLRMDAGASEYLPPFELGRPLEGWAVGRVVESRAAGFAPGLVGACCAGSGATTCRAK